MTLDELLATNEAVEILKGKHVDGGGGWLEIPEIGRSIRVSAWLRLLAGARKALTGESERG